VTALGKYEHARGILGDSKAYPQRRFVRPPTGR
jgi:hypothetical protein